MFIEQTMGRCFALLILSLFWVFFIEISSEIITAKAIRRANFDGKNNTFRNLWLVEKRAAQFCVMECAKDVQCASSLYNKVTRMCQGHSVTLGDPTEAFEQPETRYFIKEFGEHYIGDLCSTADDCWPINTECRQGSCQCMPGYSFSPKTQECKVCDQYDDLKFMEIANHYISKSNMEVIPSVSLEECIQLCVNRTDYTCVTFEYGNTSLMCSLQNVTVLDVPHRWYEDVALAFNISHFQRDCA